MNKESYNIFEKYKLVCENVSTQLGNLIGATSGGEGGNWGGSLPKLISLLPMGNWEAGSQKRSKRNTKSGFMSDHFSGNTIAYAGDFGLSSTFKNDKEAATNFAIAVARNSGANVKSWEPYVGKSFNYYTPDGYRVQVIWQSNVGGNHYDHVHVGVKRKTGTNVIEDQPLDYDSDTDTAKEGEKGSEGISISDDPNVNKVASDLEAYINSLMSSDFSAAGLKKALNATLASAFGAIKNPSSFIPKS